MALYRKYRPATFAEVVGQEQVTRPLSTALDAGRINHAYLFSGPRGCGKTSSARIMARSLNCEQGPTSTPCGVCDSCVSLAPGGPGNLDVTELDAASHNGVDDMRDLRDRAYFAPAESRYRIFIIDEAHMISNAGFNALLKVVEEPPEHVIFIFATTELEKMLPTIRSRTHNYPFRLLTPSAMKGLLQRTVAAEGVTVEDSVYPMVISAGGGSPRDTLSILDQLLAGAGPDGLTYDLARPLLGITDISVIDDAVAALAAGDKAAFFQLIDAVVESGEEPRRFATDLLDRLRDLLVLQAVPDAVAAGLVAVPEDRAEAMTNEAAAFSNAQLAHLASALNEELPKLRGASSPRLLLEIMGARLLSAPAPAAAPGPSGATAGVPAASAAASAAGPGAPAASVPSATAGAQTGAQAGAALLAARRAASAAAATPPAQPAPQQPAQQQPAQRQEQQQPTQPQQPAPRQEQQPEQSQQPTQQRQEQPQPAQLAAPQPEQPEQTQPAAETPQQQTAPGPELLEQIRASWAELRAAIGQRNKVAEIMLTEARVLGLRDETLILGHTTGALAHRINDEAKNKDIAAVLAEKTGTTLKVECIVGTSPEAAGLPPLAQPRQAWNPNQPARETDDKEAESPNEPQPSDAPSTPAPTSASGWGAPRPIGEEAESAEPAQESAPQESAESSPQPTAREGWGSPRPIGEEAQPAQQETHHHLPPRPDPTPHLRREEAAEAHPQQPMPSSAPASQQQPQDDKPDWRSRIAQAAESKRQAYEEWNKHTPSFSDGVPLPPDPGPEEDFAPPEFLPPDPEAGQAPPRPDMQQLQQSAPQNAAPAQQQAQPAQPAQTSQPAQNTQPARPAPQQPQRMLQRPAATQPESAASAAQARMAAARAQATGGVGASASEAAPGAPVDRDEEERMMAEEARTAGQHDHRTAMEVAVELLEQELGARRA
ncbi:hypothetical protein HMPREF2559_10250 [Corynebacterium sp. HMSC072G08]|uniref:DNA polymerase III subunit gamma and tau n=1 Tax=unclassified Corynebacterium TaxID=2624378 RepID=UPI00082E8624|nr:MULTISPECIES: DNA polymerase III subunit gamma and tau [unclassified Corynebacterium]OFN43237.1 hypothetical protein HMPREF2559_10250 [Corynebacterium sp. HMSC072G08]